MRGPGVHLGVRLVCGLLLFRVRASRDDRGWEPGWWEPGSTGRSRRRTNRGAASRDGRAVGPHRGPDEVGRAGSRPARPAPQEGKRRGGGMEVGVRIGDAVCARASREETSRPSQRPVSCECAWCGEAIAFRAGEWGPPARSHGLCSGCRGALLASLAEREPPGRASPVSRASCGRRAA